MKVYLLTATLLFAPALTFQSSSIQAARLPNLCSSYPNYNNATRSANPLLVLADSTGTDLDGNRVSAEAFSNDGVDRFGFMFVPKTTIGPIAPSAPNITFRCVTPNPFAAPSNATPYLEAQLPSIMFSPNPPSNTTYMPTTIATSPNWQNSLSFNLTPSAPVEPYAHFVNGSRVAGVFLGVGGRTKWRFRFNWGGNAGTYYLLRLMEDGEEEDMSQGVEARWNGVGLGLRKRQFPGLDDRDWDGYLRVVGGS